MKKPNLLVVAHPDDETIFFAGLVQTYRRKPWKIICVTDGNADGSGRKRQQDFLNACKLLKAEGEMWDFPDRYDKRLNIEKLIDRLKQQSPAEVFTHGILGEYGHPHHQDVCLATYRAFSQDKTVWSTAYNCFAEKVIRLPRKAYTVKCEILSRTYFSETHRFARWLPAYNHEGYVKLTLKEVEELYAFFSEGRAPDPKALKAFHWFVPYLEEFRSQVAARPF